MEEEVTPSEEGKVCPVSPIHKVGDTIIFKYEGNVRALVEGHEIVDGKLRYRCRAEVDRFLLTFASRGAGAGHSRGP